MAVIAFHILSAIISIAILASVAGYVWLALRGDSLILYSTIHIQNKHNFQHFPFKYKVFFTLGLIGFSIFMYAGTKEVLFWIPDEWGDFIDGEWVSTKSLIAITLACILGYPTLVCIINSTHEKFLLEEHIMLSSELEKIIDSSHNPIQLKALAEKYKNTKEELLKNKRRGLIMHIGANHFAPEEQIAQNYKQLIHIVENLIKKCET